MAKQKLAGVTIFGLLILLSSFVHMSKLVEDATWYFETYGYMPAWLTTTRYCFSWFQRIVGITGAILVLKYHEWGRKILIAIGVFTITTVYWKHPYIAVKAHAQSWQKSFPLEVQQYSLETIALWATFILIILDVVFQSVLIYYFTRKDVKEAFQK